MDRTKPSGPRDARAGARDTRAGKAFVAAAALYLAWVLATWLLEKRVGLFARFDPVGRTLYALVANVGIGTLLAGRLVGPSVQWRARALVLTVVAGLGALVLTRAVPPASREPIVLLNAFAQILPTSIAEVVVCWLLVGGVAREAAKPLGPAISTIVAIAAADVVFAVYHVAHSPPFDEPAMIAFLALPGLVVGVLVFVVRDRVAAIVAQNLLAMIGVTKSLDPDVFRHPFVWAYAVAVVAAVAAFAVLRRADRPAAP